MSSLYAAHFCLQALLAAVSFMLFAIMSNSFTMFMTHELLINRYDIKCLIYRRYKIFKIYHMY